MNANNTFKPHLLIVDDDDRIRQLLSDFLQIKDFATTQAASADAAGRILKIFDVDLIILDYMMPERSGVDFLSDYRTNNSTPVIMLTAKSELKDRLEGLSAGADDYLAKPFAPEELYLRIKSVLGRVQPKAEAETFMFGKLSFDLKSRQLQEGSSMLHLTENEEALLISLIAAKGAVKSRDALAEEFGAAPRSIDVLMTRLRRKIETDPTNPKHIKTVRGVGYKLLLY